MATLSENLQSPSRSGDVVAYAELLAELIKNAVPSVRLRRIDRYRTKLMASDDRVVSIVWLSESGHLQCWVDPAIYHTETVAEGQKMPYNTL